MKEDFLHFIWRLSYFSSSALVTTTGESIIIHKTGYWNKDAGPDFKEAIIEIDGIRLAGNVEIHVASGDWFLHHHDTDEAYKTVVLHVVWELSEKNIQVPTLELKHFVDPEVVKRYKHFTTSEQPILCASQLQQVSDLCKSNMLETTLVERLERKAQEIINDYHKTHDWSEVAYRLFMKYMGFKVNNEAFISLSEALPLKCLLKHRNHPFQVEALLFGQSGLLFPIDEYSEALQKEYDFLKQKYHLANTTLHPSLWKFLRLRPSNFPTIRLAQVAQVINACGDLYSIFMAVNSVNDLTVIFKNGVSDYWKKHYHFGEKWQKPVKGKVGVSSVQQLFTNVVIPLQVAVALYKGDEELKYESIEKLYHLPAEKNHKTALMQEAGFKNASAADSQSLLQLHDAYCKKKYCLQCKIGVSILKR